MRRLPVAVIALLIALSSTPALASQDALFHKQWALQQIGAPDAWSSSTGRGVRIGIVDTGVDLTHEDLAGKVVAHTSCIGSGGDSSRCHGSGQDDNGHGTHVAGIAAAITGNGKGVSGVAPDAELVVAKVLNSEGAGTIEDINAGIRWVVDHGARVVNLSLGDPNFLLTSVAGTPLSEGVEYAWAHGAVPVLAAGNTNPLGLGLLGSSDYGDLNAIVVTATGPDNRPANYASPVGNAKWGIAAPGGAGDNVRDHDVLSTIWVSGKHDQYASLAGTSMASPHLAGAVALLLAQGSSPQQAVERLLHTADGCGASCPGRLNLPAAVHR